MTLISVIQFMTRQLLSLSVITFFFTVLNPVVRLFHYNSYSKGEINNSYSSRTLQKRLGFFFKPRVAIPEGLVPFYRNLKINVIHPSHLNECKFKAAFPLLTNPLNASTSLKAKSVVQVWHNKKDSNNWM